MPGPLRTNKTTVATSRKPSLVYKTAHALFLSAFRFEAVAYSAARNSFAFYGFTPVNDFGV
jgi:hypothetical protein